jgi:hypothetical protein
MEADDLYVAFLADFFTGLDPKTASPERRQHLSEAKFAFSSASEAAGRGDRLLAAAHPQ